MYRRNCPLEETHQNEEYLEERVKGSRKPPVASPKKKVLDAPSFISGKVVLLRTKNTPRRSSQVIPCLPRSAPSGIGGSRAVEPVTPDLPELPK